MAATRALREGGGALGISATTRRAQAGRSVYARNLGIDDRLEVHPRAARRNGLDDEGLTERMILLTAYLGQPYPSAAMAAVRRTAGS